MTRLIDADELKIKFWHGDLVPNKEMFHISEIKYAIDNASTVDERPKGKWIRDIQGDTICSNCGFECLYNEEGLYSLGRYCHHCGADMRGDEE